jgi:hypothetical protein
MYWLFPFEEYFAGKVGGAIDLLVSKDSTTPVWMYIGGVGGLRANVTKSLYLEVPVELGLFPFFDGGGTFLKVGFQVGFGF